MIRNIARTILPDFLRRHLRGMIDGIYLWTARKDLDKIGAYYKTDKAGEHFYTPHYQSHFQACRLKNIKLLEIGVGGYDDPNKGGSSLRMWKKYFPNGKIYAIDIFDKSGLQEERIKIFQGSQVDSPFLEKVTRETGGLDIIIDDGSHVNSHVIESFNLLFPKLNDGGIYVIEDVQTSYWEDYGGDSSDLNNPATMMNFFKSLTDCLNHKEIVKPGYQPGYYDKKIISIHFYHNLIFIYKGNNDEESNVVKNNAERAAFSYNTLGT